LSSVLLEEFRNAVHHFIGVGYFVMLAVRENNFGVLDLIGEHLSILVEERSDSDEHFVH
jgi:hypothetical protein